MRVRTGGAWKEVSSGRVRVGNAWKNLVRIRAYVGGVWRDVANFVLPLTASASPSSQIAGRIGAGAVTSSTVTAMPAGGLAPFTYSWALVTGSGGTINASTSASTTFSRVMGEDEAVTNVFRCTITDALSSTATADASVDFISTPSDFS